MDPRKLKAFTDESATLRKPLAEQILNNAMLKDPPWIARRPEAHGGCFAKVATPAARRDDVAHLCEVHEVSRRWGHSVPDVDRPRVSCRSERRDDVGADVKVPPVAG